MIVQQIHIETCAVDFSTLLQTEFEYVHTADMTIINAYLAIFNYLAWSRQEISLKKSAAWINDLICALPCLDHFQDHFLRLDKSHGLFYGL